MISADMINSIINSGEQLDTITMHERFGHDGSRPSNPRQPGQKAAR